MLSNPLVDYHGSLQLYYTYVPADASSRARWDEQTLVQIIDGDKI
jgi:hypothetical protein